MQRILFTASFCALLIANILTPVWTHAAEKQATRPTVICLGDSITHAGYPAELEKMLPIQTINAGVNGNTSRQGLARLEKDVLSHKPDAVIIFFGTNDNRRDAPKVFVPVDEYKTNLSRMIKACRSSGAKVLLGTLPPIDSEPYFKRHLKADFDAAGGLEKLVEQYRAAAQEIGKLEKGPVVDLNKLLASDTSWRGPDGVHPTVEGNKVIARQFVAPLAKALSLKQPGAH